MNGASEYKNFVLANFVCWSCDLSTKAAGQVGFVWRKSIIFGELCSSNSGNKKGCGQETNKKEKRKNRKIKNRQNHEGFFCREAVGKAFFFVCAEKKVGDNRCMGCFGMSVQEFF